MFDHRLQSFQARCQPSSRLRVRGFTLIELMIAVAIVAIIAAIALPSYNRYVLRAHRAPGHDVIMAVASAQERFYTNFNRYATTLAEIGFGTADATSEGGYYIVSLPATGDTQTYTVLATPQGSQANDLCKNLTLTNAGVKGFTGTQDNGNCW
jgi:type IV pilus assembly protein PilE